MSSSTADELRRTQQYLAEVIDECVFVERQRDLMERRLTSQIAGQTTAMDATVAALRHLCDYTQILEGALLPGLLAVLPPSAASRQSLLLARAEADAQLRRLVLSAEREGSSSNSSSRNGLHFLPPLPEASPPTSAPSVSLPPEASADAVSCLLQHKARLLEALAQATTRVQDMQLSVAGEGAELAGLRARMDELTQLVSASANAAPAAPAPAPHSQASPVQQEATATTMAVRPAPSPSAAVRFAQARVMAYEKTAQALNNELALLHENYAALSRASAAEAERLRRKNAEAQRRHEEQVAECDAVLGRLSLELEQLIRENAQLKEKMRAAVHTDV